MTLRTRSRASSRREREREIVEATRALFDERGLQDAPIDEIARAVGVNKAIIYRHFASKEDLFVQTVALYLSELAALLREVDPDGEPVDALRRCAEAHCDYCLAHPAYVDCALSLLRRPAADLRERVSDAVWLHLAQTMAECLGLLARILAAGAERGAFRVEDPDFVANLLYTQALGTMALARLGVAVCERADGLPGSFEVEPERVRDACVAACLAVVGAA